MPVRIRLKRMGRKKAPHYRIVVADGASPRDGRFVETLGYYKPTESPARVVVDLERVDHWIGQGAQPSQTVTSLLKRARNGSDDKIAVGALDPEEVKAQKAAALEARRQAETAARQEAAAAEAAAVAAAEAAAKVEAEEAAAAAAAEAEEAAEADANEDDVPVVEAVAEEPAADDSEDAAGDEEE